MSRSRSVANRVLTDLREARKRLGWDAVMVDDGNFASYSGKDVVTFGL